MAGEPTSTDLAYLAGIIDGEGCIDVYCNRKDKVQRGRLTIVNTNPRLHEWLNDRFPGGYTHHRARAKANWKRSYATQWRDRTLVKILQAVSPYLVLKREQADLCVKLTQLRDMPRDQRYLYRPRRYGRGIGVDRFVRSEMRVEEEGLRARIRVLNRTGVTSLPDLPYVAPKRQSQAPASAQLSFLEP
jgi:hypothetical protein